ncbi:hypothetical protein CLF_104796 [Clonorchis sinensis]|uniref:MULE transposase domain-containing protein n=1 Tax=Clonorchis sinensis TaxID=79923 RepID=G7YCD0_CLOSI|nr:hypothetical protein CLF_104796 [Clonorchis sinensis]
MGELPLLDSDASNLKNKLFQNDSKNVIQCYGSSMQRRRCEYRKNRWQVYMLYTFLITDGMGARRPVTYAFVESKQFARMRKLFDVFEELMGEYPVKILVMDKLAAQMWTARVVPGCSYVQRSASQPEDPALSPLTFRGSRILGPERHGKSQSKPAQEEHELSFFRNIQPIACLLSPNATCDPVTLGKASILIDAIAVEICQRIECRHQVLVFNQPDLISLERTKTAILTACGMLNTACTARRLRKLKPSICCPIIMQFQDENYAMLLLTSQILLFPTEKFRTIKVRATRTGMQRQLTKKLLPSTRPSDAP